MATYQYRCEQDGVQDVRLPIGTAPEAYPCPVCGGSAARVFSAPMLSLAARPLMSAIDNAERSKDAPEVVTSIPPPARRRPAAPANPLLKHLPRP